jgi:pyrroloquinoline quinone (PQQ) biosynthesis protein C
MDKFQEMRVFAAVVGAGSFVAAAEALGMSKAAVSRYEFADATWTQVGGYASTAERVK